MSIFCLSKPACRRKSQSAAANSANRFKSIPDVFLAERKAWLDSQPRTRLTAPERQGDFEESVVWRGVFIAAFIVIVINIPASPPTVHTHAPVRATV